MRSFRDISIRTKLMLLLVGVVSVALVLSSAALAVNDVRMIQSSMAKRLSTLADVLGANCTAALNFEVKRTAEEVLDSLRLQSIVVCARVYGKDGETFADYAVPGLQHGAPPELRKDADPFSQDGYLHLFRPIIQDKEQIGTVYLQANQDEIYEQLRGYAWVVAIVLVASLGVTILLASRVQRVISRPLFRLVDATQIVTAKADYSTRVERESEDELGKLCDAFNSMLAQIQERDVELAQHRLHLEGIVEERTRKLEAKGRELRRSNAELEQFAYIASHDLQEPLRKIQTFSDMLTTEFGDAIPEGARDYLQRMQSAAARMQVLINDLLTFARVMSQAKPFVEVDLTDVARAVVSDLEGRIQQTGGRVEIGDLPKVQADPTQMWQLLQNLIGNGLKYHRTDESPLVKVEAHVLHHGDGPLSGLGLGDEVCRLQVTDNGIGFDMKYAERIFAPFQRLHGRGEYDGTGMGLTVCRKIVTRHGGVITAESSPGHGATFIVTLPMKQSQAAEDGQKP